MKLIQKKCVPCEGNEPPLTRDQIKNYLSQIGQEWKVINDKKISREFKFKDFASAMVFVNKIAGIAEQEGHHPDITIHYNRVGIELWTHAIEGLSENDFILAAKIEAL